MQRLIILVQTVFTVEICLLIAFMRLIHRVLVREDGSCADEVRFLILTQRLGDSAFLPIELLLSDILCLFSDVCIRRLDHIRVS